VARIKPYTLAQAQQLVADAQRRMSPYHQEWDVLERLLATGTVEDFAVSVGLDNDEIATLLRDTVGAAPETVNLILPHINIILASVIDRDPRLLCEPLRGGTEQADRALIAQALINYYWRRTKATDALRDATQDMVVCGNGFLKVGWNYVESASEPMSGSERQALLDMADEAAQLGDNGMAELVQAVIEADEPFVSYVSPYDMFVPADARRMSESRWVAQRLRLPLSELKAREDLANLDTLVADSSNAMSSSSDRGYPNRGVAGADSDVFATAEVFEFYDLRTHTMMVFQANAAKPLYSGAIPYRHRHAPYVHIGNYRSRQDEFWAFGELRNVAPLQMAYNEAIREQLANFRRSGQKYLAASELMTDEVADALMSDIPDLVVRVDLPPDRNISDLIQPVFRPALSSDTYAIVSTMREAMSAVLGINDFQSGGMGADRMSATAAAVVDGVATLRAQDKIAAVERAASHTGNLLLRLAQEFISPDTAVAIVGADGGWMDARIRAEMIDGEFDVSVEGGSTQAVNPATKQRRAMERLNTLMPMLAQGGYDTEPLLRSIVADFDLDPNLILRRPTPAAAPMEQPADAGSMLAPMPDGGPLADVPGLNLDAATEGDVIL
jgi:hypothetical protein